MTILIAIFVVAGIILIHQTAVAVIGTIVSAFTADDETPEADNVG